MCNQPLRYDCALKNFSPTPLLSAYGYTCHLQKYLGGGNLQWQSRANDLVVNIWTASLANSKKK